VLRELLFAGCAWVASSAFAVESPARVEAADGRTKQALELMQVIHFDKTIDAIQGQLRSTMENQLEPLAKCDAAQPIVHEFGTKLTQATFDTLQSDEFKVDIAAIYAEVFSEDELHQIIDFYHSPLGAKLLDRMPQLMQKSMQVTQERMKLLMPDIQKMGQSYGEKLAAVCGGSKGK